MANNKLRNYFQTLGNKDDNEANLEDIQLRKAKATGAPSDELTHIASEIYRLDSGFRSRDAHEIPTQIQKANKIILANYSFMVLRALASALKKNQTVQEIEITEVSCHTDRGFQRYPTEDAAFYLREILSIPRIRFHVSAKCEELYSKIFRGPSLLKNITHLKVTIETALLDKLITYVCEEGVISICTKRLRGQETLTLHNLSRFGGFHHLNHLKIQVFGSEGEELFKALQNIKSLRTLDLSKSIIPQRSAAFLADLIGQDKNITTLNLTWCEMDNNSLSIVCKELIRNTAIQSLDLTGIKPFKTIDLSIVGNITNKKKLKELKIDLFNISAAKCFNVDHLIAAFIDFNTDKQTVGHKVDFEVSCITVSFIKPAPKDQQQLSKVIYQNIRELFTGLNENSTQIKSVTIRYVSPASAAEELMRQLKSNRTLKRCVVKYMWSSDLAWKLLVEVAETNDTLEELIINEDRCYIEIDDNTTMELLKTLKKNKSLTTLGLHGCERQIERVKELLTANPYISFMYDNYWSSTQGIITSEYEEAIALNNKNKQNIKHRAWRMKMNTLILARSYLSSMVPMEIWEEIFTFVDKRMEHFGVFKLSIVRK